MGGSTRRSRRYSKHSAAATRSALQKQRQRLAVFEGLEGRELFSVVTNTNDSGAGSLRQAILDANAASGAQIISFAIPSSPGDVETISLASALPVLTNAITLDGATQSGYTNSPLIVIDGSAAANGSGAISFGLELTGANENVRGIAIEGFADAQLHLAGAGHDTVIASVFGVGTDASAPGLGNAVGILVDSSNNLVGGLLTADRNLIAENAWNGITINVGHNQIVGNWIGLNSTGSTADPNGNNGIEIDAATDIQIKGNVISGNNGDGIAVNGVTLSGVVITGNIIGLDASGTNVVANTIDGIGLTNGSHVTIGGTLAADRNILSGNSGSGIALSNSSSNLVQGNFIGTDATGTLAFDPSNISFGNNANNISIDGSSSNNTIGGATVGARNVISASSGNGIDLETGNFTNVIQGNYIGTDVTGLLALDANSNSLGNAGDGIYTGSGGAQILGNLIANNGDDGILLVAGSVVKGNKIGVGADGVTALGNGQGENGLGAGIFISGSGNTIGGTGAGEGNLIANNAKQGVVVASGQHNSIRGNSIFLNGGIGIDLGNDGVTLNASHPPGGPNNYQHFPQIDSATNTAGSLALTGQIDTAPGTYTLDFYTSPAADPSGFGEGKTYIGSLTVTVGASGHATFSTTLSVSGSNTVITATATDSLGSTSEFSGATGIVNAQVATTTTLSSSVNPSTFGQSVTFTATVTPANNTNGTPTGAVEFFDGATSLGTGTLNGSGVATLTTSTLSLGTHNVTAVYSDNTSFTGSTSAPVSQLVNQASTTATVISSVNPSVFGQSVTLTAMVASSIGGDPTGTVTFMDGSTVLDTVTLSTGVASITTSSLGVGGHAITATYNGSTNLAGSTGSLTQNVNQASTSTSVVSDTNPSVIGQSVTFTATVSIDSPGAGSLIGLVSFFDGSTPLGTGSLSSGTATFTTSSLSVGHHSITAMYAGDANFSSSTSSSLDQVVNPASSSTSVSSSVNPSVVGQSVTFTATVSSTSGTPTGTVSFMDGGTLLGTASLSGGTASLTTSALAVGSHAITAMYSGDTNFTGSSGDVTQVVNQAATTTTISSSVNPTVFGQSTTLTASVSSVNAPAVGLLSGTVTFMDGSTILDTVALNGDSASLSISTLAVGAHSITATYNGSANFAGSTGSLTQNVNSADTSTTISSSANPSTAGQSVTFTANVSVTAPGAGTLTGTVTFMDGSTTLGTGTVSGGVATFTTSGLTVGPHTITAVYSGDGSFNTSTSAPLTQTVNSVPPPQNTLTGRTLVDQTGNGLTSDDTPLGGVTVSVYRDVNANGALDPGDGSAVATTVSNATTGVYSISLSTNGIYFARETVPTNYIRTVPVLSDYYTATLTGGTTVGNLDFDNFKKCTATVTGVTYKVNHNGSITTVTGLRGNTHQGDTVTVYFMLSNGPDEITLVSYNAPGPSFDANVASQQTIFDIDSQMFNNGPHSLTVTIPSNYYQIDFVRCEAIDHFGPAGSNIFYSAQNRLISADNAGTHSDVDDMAATTNFWAHLGQSLIKAFDTTGNNPYPTDLGDWLASTFPNVYGSGGSYNLAGKTNAQVASTFLSFFNDQAHHRTDASMMATALSVYASTSSLGGDAAGAYGFDVTDAGLGAASFNVGNNGAAFNVANNSTMTVMQLLLAANAKSSQDVLYNGVTSMLTMAYNMFESINNSGGIS